MTTYIEPALILFMGFVVLFLALTAVFGLQDIFIDRRRMAALISKDKTSNCSSHGVLSSLILRSSSVKTKYSELPTTYSELSDSRPRVALIKSIPRIWRQGVKQLVGQGELRTPNSKGFTLIEVISVMIIVAILAATVLPRIDFGATSSTASANGAAYMIASDIRYTQECAMARLVSKSISFTSGQSVYTFPATTPSTSSLDPTGRLPSGVTIGATITFTFNSLGEPTAGGGSSVTVSSGGITKTITVVNYTGKVNIS
jgi:prepilin-type N-terminal cleavage/methylation domain-containing protein